MGIKTEDFKKVEVTSIKELRYWLQRNHNQKESVWLITFKKNVPSKYISTNQALDELISFGWIDGIRRKLNDEKTMQLISPRKTQYWAKTYKERAERLIQEKKMRSAGFASIELAKESGLWNFMDDVDDVVIPDDLMHLLNQNAPALQNFQNFSTSIQRNILRWVKLAKTDKTRSKRIGEIAKNAKENIALRPNG